MDLEKKRKQSFLLRLPLSVREQATEIAREEGTSLNHFISLAVAEKISRMKQKPSPNLIQSNPSLTHLSFQMHKH